MVYRSWHNAFAFLVVALLVGGCSYGRSHNPTRPRYWLLPFGDIVRTHAKPSGFGYNDDFDPRSAHLDIQVLRPVAPVRSQQIIVATVVDERGQPLKRRRVEWMLEGAGNIIEVDESGLLPGRGYKVDNDYAVTYTSLHEHSISRFNGRPQEDFTVRSGQTWCVVSSAVPGQTQLTVYAPGIANWDENRKVATLQWSGDGGTQPLPTTPSVPSLPAPPPEGIPPIGGFPPPEGVPGGTEHPRHLQPIPEVTLFQSAPSSATIGENLPVNVQLTNSSVKAAKTVTVQARLDPNLEYVRSDPPAVVDGNRLIWTLSEIPPQSRRTLQLVCRSKREGPSSCLVNMQTGEGIRDEKEVTVQILPRVVGKLELLQQGPTNLLMSNSNTPKSETIQVSVSNAGTGAATNVVMKAELVGLVEAKTSKATVETKIGTLLPGATIRVPLTVRPLRAGQALCRVQAEGDGGLRTQSEHRLDVRESGLELKLNGPASRPLGRPVVWDLVVTNTGNSPLSDVMVSDILPPELEFVTADENGTFRGREVLWRLGTLQPKQTRRLQLTTKASRATPSTTQYAFAKGTVGSGSTTRPVGRVGTLPTLVPGAGLTVETKAQAKLKIEGYASLRMSVGDRQDPVAVGKSTMYRIDVSNDGSVADRRVQIVARLPNEMRIVRITGPTSYRVNGTEVTFAPLATLPPGQTVTCVFEVQALTKGDARFRAELTSATLTEPIFKEESTNIP